MQMKVSNLILILSFIFTTIFSFNHDGKNENREQNLDSDSIIKDHNINIAHQYSRKLQDDDESSTGTNTSSTGNLTISSDKSSVNSTSIPGNSTGSTNNSKSISSNSTSISSNSTGSTNNSTSSPSNSTNIPGNSTNIPNNSTNSTNGTSSSTKSEKIYPTAGSFYSAAYSFNYTLPTDFKVERAILVSRTGARRLKEIVDGQFIYEENFTNEKNQTTTVKVASTNSKLVGGYHDVFKQKWNYSFNDFTPIANKSAQEYASNIISLYRDKLKLITLNTTTEIVFVAGSLSANLQYTQAIVKYVYNELSLKKNLTDFIRAPEGFTWESLDYEDFNKDGYWPAVGQLLNEYTYALFGFDFPYVCPKYQAWNLYSATQDSNLRKYYNERFSEVLDIFSNYFQENAETIFYNTLDEVYLNLTDYQIRYNITVGRILVTNLLVDGLFFNWPDDLKEFIPPIGGMKLLNEMMKFLDYEVYSYSDLHMYLIISPLFKFLFSEFNTHMKMVNGYYMPNLSPNFKSRKITYFSGYYHSIQALYNMMNYDWRIKEAGALTSFPDTWSMANVTFPGKLPDIPLVEFGEGFSFELISLPHTAVKGAKNFFIGFRRDFRSTYEFVLSVEDFSALSQLMLIVPEFTEKERTKLCR
jgi:hypothetical protein